MELVVPDRYRAPLRQHDFAALIAHVSDLLDELDVGGPRLLARAESVTSDGFPASTRPGGGSGSGRSDSTVEAAVFMRMANPVSDMAGEMCQALLAARDAARAATRALRRSIVPTKTCWQCRESRPATEERCWSCKAGPSEPTEASCIVHARFELVEPVRARARCRFCNDWNTEHDCDPPESVIRDLEDKRIEREMRKAA